MRRRLIESLEWTPLLLLAGIIVCLMLSGCGTTPRERVATEEGWFTATVDVLTQARLSGAIDKRTFHETVLPAIDVANARLREMHRQAATQPSVNVDQMLATDAAWREAKAKLLQWLIEANAKK